MATIGTFLVVCALVSLLLVLGSPRGSRPREA
jgi:hypothetical protein